MLITSEGSDVDVFVGLSGVTGSVGSVGSGLTVPEPSVTDVGGSEDGSTVGRVHKDEDVDELESIVEVSSAVVSAAKVLYVSTMVVLEAGDVLKSVGSVVASGVSVLSVK